MLLEFMRSLRLTVLTISVCVVAYTALILGYATLVAREKRLGSLLYGVEGKIIGSRFVAQAFSRREYLWPRPSAVDYNAAGAGGSNLSPTNPKIREQAEAILAKYALADGATLPADLVTASGSGLDPHISLEAALIQADRIAMSRHVDVSIIRELIQNRRAGLEARHITVKDQNADMDGRGSPSHLLEYLETDSLVNVLEFNLLLDKQINSAESP